MRVSIIATAIVVVAFAWLPSFVDARRAPRPPGTGLAHVAVGRPPPDFAFPSDGATTRLSSFAGRPVVLNFWASWCEPCDDELPAFAQLEKTYGDDVVFIAISDESSDVADAFLKAHGIDARLVSDPPAHDLRFVRSQTDSRDARARTRWNGGPRFGRRARLARASGSRRCGVATIGGEHSCPYLT